MATHLKKLVSALGAYQVANIFSKIMAILLLPVYTGKIAPGGYGMVETLATFVIFVSIVVRFGMIEAFLRYYFTDEDAARRDLLVRRAAGFLLVTTTISCIIIAIPAGPLSMLITSRHHPGAFRVAVLGIWAFTNLELAQAVLRVDMRIRAYATVTLINAAGTIALSVILVVVLNKGWQGLLFANYAISTVVLIGLWYSMRERLFGPRVRAVVGDAWRTLLRFGLPTLPAEASVYALSVLDRQYLIHQHGPAAAGRYAIAIKVAGAIAFIVNAFQYAWPPLAYSITDDAQAARLYGLVTTYYTLIAGWVVAAVTLESRYIIRFLAPHDGYFAAYRAIPWVSLGWALYGLWVVLLVIAGRAKVTQRNFPAAIVGLICNVALLVLLVPHFGIAGAGVALVGAYVAMLTVMHLLVRRAFAAAFEWRRLLHLLVVIGGFAVAGDLLLPTDGFIGLVLRAAVIVAIAPVLWATGFLHRAEVQQGLDAIKLARSRFRAASA
jgi:O-antigen/teichoic acid export membrane protein